MAHASSGSLSASEPVDPMESAVLSKVTLRLIPFLFLLYIINLIDRTNIAIASAKSSMLIDLEMSEQAYGWGAGLFYVGYLLFEVPSNIMMLRIGARRWIARILVSWGLVSACMMFVTGEWSFYALRVMLGVAEAGFFPGIIFYLSEWFPARTRATAVAKFMVAGLISSIVGNLVSGAILQYTKELEPFKNWQWLFLLEGIPAVLLGFVTYYFLTDSPAQATWLQPEERNWLIDRLSREQKQLGHRDAQTLLSALADPRVWLLIGVYFTVAMGDNSFGFFLPKMLASKFPDWSELEIGYLAAAPSVIGVLAMIIVGKHSDYRNERRWHVACSAFTASAGWLLAANAPTRWTAVAGLTLALIGMKGMLPTFWAIPTSFLTGPAAAGGVALINSLANLGGLLGPGLMGRFKGDGNYTTGLFILSGVLFAGGLLVLRVPPTATTKTD